MFRAYSEAIKDKEPRLGSMTWKRYLVSSNSQCFRSSLGISESHFLVAGGLILLLLAARNLLVGERGETPGSTEAETIGVFPIGVPLVVGPAVLTTLLVFTGRYSIPAVLVAFLLNLGCA